MLKKLSKKLNKKAFTLIEIVLAIALLSVVAASIGSIIVSTQNNATKMFTESELQQQLVEVQEAIHNEILATNAGIKYWVKKDVGGYFEPAEKDTGEEYEKLLAFYNVDMIDFVLSKTYYLYNSEDKTLKIAQLEEQLDKNNMDSAFEYSVDDDIASTLVAISKWTLTSENMESFSIDVSTYGLNKLISCLFEIKQGNSSYPTDDTIYVRNTISINKDLVIDKYRVVELKVPQLQNINFAYDGQEHGPHELNYLERYMVRSSDSVLTATDYGTYTVTYKLKDKNATVWVDERGNKSTADITHTWTIEQKTVSLIWGQKEWTYDGLEHSTTCDIDFVVEGEDCRVELENNLVGPEIGTKECTAKLVGAHSNNYSLPSNSKVTLEIVAAEPTVDINTVDSTYNGDPQNIVTYSNLVGGSLRYYVSTDPTTPILSMVNQTSCTVTDAGTYYVWYRIVADDAHGNTGVIKIERPAVIYRSPTAKVTSANKTYNRNEQVGVSGTFVDITGISSATNAGQYVAYAVPDKNHLWEDGTDTQETISWSIAKAKPSLTISSSGGTITHPGNISFEVVGNPSGGQLSVDVEDPTVATAMLKGTTVNIISGINGGNSTKIVVSAAETENYNATSIKYTVTVSRGALLVTASGYNGVYDGKPHSISVSCDHEGRKISYSTDGETYLVSKPAFTNAGEYKLYYQVTADGYETVQGYKTVVITKATSNLALSANECTITYPTETSIEVTTNTSKGSISATTSNANIATVNAEGNVIHIVPGTQSGTATIVVRSEETTNYRAASTTCKVTVEKGKLNPTVLNYEALYDGNAHGITVACSGATITYGTSAGVYDKTSSPTYTNVGEYTVYFRVVKDGYEDYEGSAKVIIDKAKGTMTLSANKGETNYPSVKTINVTTNSGGTLTATTSDSAIATASVNEKQVVITPGTKTGTATITINAAATNNYTAVSETYTIIVNAGELNVMANGYNGVYDRKAHGITVTCDVSGATISYSSDGGQTYSATAVKYTNVCSGKTVHYKVEKAGYNTVTGSATITITKADGQLTLSSTNLSLKYPASSTVTVSTNLSGGDISVVSSNSNIATATMDSSGNIKIQSGTTAGTATITVTSAATDNYKSASTKITVGVQSGTLNVTSSGYSGEYDGNAYGITVNCAGATIKYGLSVGEYNLTESPTRTEVGTTTVYYQVTKIGYETVVGSEDIVIKKTTPTVTLSETEGTITYPAKTTFTATSNSSGIISASSSDTNIATVSVNNGTVTVVSGTTSGTAIITVKVAESTTYGVGTAKYTVTVSKGTLSPTINGHSAQYDGNAHGITITCDGATIKYGESEDSYTMTTSPTRTDVGTTTVYFKITKAGYKDYNGSAKIVITAKRDASVSGDGSTFMFDGSTHTGLRGVNVDFTSGLTSASQVSTYIVKAKPKANHGWSDTGGTEERTFSWTITEFEWMIGDACRITENAQWADGTSVSASEMNELYYVVEIKNDGYMTISSEDGNVINQIHKDFLIYEN